MSRNNEQLLTSGNEKALLEQGSVLPTTPTKALKVVEGDYQPFSGIAISCLQFIEHEPCSASLRVSAAKRHGTGLRVSINGRDGRAACFLTNAQQIDELVMRLEKLKVDMFGKSVGVVK